MQLVHVYLNFPGNAEEAFQFYETVFQTKIVMKVTFGEAPFVPNVTEAAKKKLMHVQLQLSDAVHLMGSDWVEGVSPSTFQRGNNFSISIVGKDKAEADRVFAALSGGGEIRMPIGNAPWGPYFGMVTDRFHTQWMVSLTGPA